VPTPSKTSNKQIVAVSLGILKSKGASALTLATVAKRVGVRAPSLYRRFADREALMREVELEVFRDLSKHLEVAAGSKAPYDALRAMAHAYRDYAHTFPDAYRLMFSAGSSGNTEETVVRLNAAMPLLSRLRGILGPSTPALAIARTMTAYLHGFTSMELSGAFRLADTVEEDFHAGLDLLLKAVGAIADRKA
jgi:AcrR family transcriptional regulator